MTTTATSLQNIYFIFGDPSSLMVFSNLARIVKKNLKDVNTIAIIYEHAYLKNLDTEQFLDAFDSIHYVPMCDFHRNILSGYVKVIKFKRAIKKIKIEPNSVIFAFYSMELTINILLKYVERFVPDKNIFLFSYSSVLNLIDSKSKFLNFVNYLYSIIFRAYPMISYVNNKGDLVYRKYKTEPKFSKIELFNPERATTADDKNGSGSLIRLPYPLVKRPNGAIASKVIVFFGDSTIFDFHPQLDKKFYITKLNKLMARLKEKCSSNNITLLYKPHPLDNGALLEGFNMDGFTFFDQKLNAEMMFSKYWENIIASYSVSSYSIFNGSQYGIPSYWLFPYCFSDEELKSRFHFVVVEQSSTLLKEVYGPEDMGSIDNLKKELDLNGIEKQWYKAMGNIFKGGIV